MRPHIMNFVVLLILAAVVFLGIQPGQAAQPAAGPTDAAELGAFLDGAISVEMAQKHIQGAVVSVVKDGSLMFTQGYGYTDLGQQQAVDPEHTLFRPGSISKLFVWTAVMQLVEQGKLSLDADVNQYLDFTIPATFPQAITLTHIMTHTTGFEDVGADLFKLDPAEIHPLGEYLKTHLPMRVYPPGEIGGYSNYATAMAGYIVERVSGVPFEQYVEEHIFAPLGMQHSTFRQPLPAGLAADMSGGFNYASGGYLAGEFEYVQAYPAGSLSTTAVDMTRFMIAHLQNGEFDGARILQEDTAKLMHEHLFSHDPRMPGMAHGFFENVINGQRVISHGGDTILFHSGLYLLVDQNVGLFISTNSTGGSGAADAVFRAFMDYYYPQDSAARTGASRRFRAALRQVSGTIYFFTQQLQHDRTCDYPAHLADQRKPRPGGLPGGFDWGANESIRGDCPGFIPRPLQSCQPTRAARERGWYDYPVANRAFWLYQNPLVRNFFAAFIFADRRSALILRFDVWLGDPILRPPSPETGPPIG